MLARMLVVAAVAWPLVAGGAVWHRASHPHGGERFWASIVYLAGSQICHQRPERSFRTQGVSWPVCARCSGLYLSAPFGAVAVFARRRRVRPGLKPGTSEYEWRARASARAASPGLKPGTSVPLGILALAAVPTVLTLMWEWGGLGTPSNLWRFTTALPLGAAIMWVLVAVAQPSQTDRIN